MGWLNRRDFLAIATWKSPRPKRWYEANSDVAIQSASRAAFASSNECEKVVRLTALCGVNVRTATAILHACYTDQFPLLDFRALASLGISQEITNKWDEMCWLRVWPMYCARCRKIAREAAVSMRTLDRALWIYNKLEEPGRRKRPFIPAEV